MSRRSLTILTVCGLLAMVVHAGFAQTISDIVVTDHSNVGAVITWVTDSSTSTNQVEYGTTTSLGTFAFADGDTGETSGSGEVHRVALSFTTEVVTTFYFQVTSDGSPSAQYSFNSAEPSSSTSGLTLYGFVVDTQQAIVEGAIVVTTLRDYLNHGAESADGLLVGDTARRSSYE